MPASLVPLNYDLFVVNTYLLDILWGQLIKPIQVFSTSEFYEYWWNNIVFTFFCPLHFVQGLRSKNVKYSQVSIKRANSLNTYGMVLSELARLIET